MRESIGATWIFGIVIVFVTIFTGYLAFSVNFSKAFAFKDEIIDVLEKYDGPGDDVIGEIGNGSTKALEEIASYTREINYGSKGSCEIVLRRLYGDETYSKKRNSIMGVNISVIPKPNGTYATVTRADSFLGEELYHFCLVREGQTGEGNDAYLSFSSYRVITFFSININILRMFGNYYVSGETKNISYPKDAFLEEGTLE